MNRLIIGTATALALAVGFGGVIRAQTPTPNQLTVSVEGLPPGSTLSIAINGGKIGNKTTTATPASNGAVEIALDLGNLGKAEDNVQVDVYMLDKCPNNQIRLQFIQQGGTLPGDDGCSRKKIGVIIWWKVTKLTIKYPDGIAGGMSDEMKYILIGGGAAAVVIVATRGGSDTTTTTPGGTTTNLTFASGNWGGSGFTSSNGCNFSPTATATGNIQVTDSTNATITWTKVHTSAGVTFVFTGVHLTLASATKATFTATKTQAIGSATYAVTDAGSIDGTTLTLVQTFSNSTCTTVYSFTFTKQ